MTTIDIRQEPTEVTTIVFADKETNAKFKVTSITKSSSGVDAIRLNWDGDYAYIRHSNIDDMIAALQKAKELWT